ncbi:hypothetical protein F8M41_018241 [Gigaspora margarita]|uniref:Kelch repeat protein n=1 Tax=Gigaspora margarita TaxID=4874 RepID=A0A8H4AM04_GIGMA|nr:hypothetical protein F8M41_018241 [Gigaspora margarita]
MHNNIQAVSNQFGQIFIYGGQYFTSNNSSSAVYNNMNILLSTNNYNTILWTTLPIRGSSYTSFIPYTAILLSNGCVVYIGGIQETQTTSANLMTMYIIEKTITLKTISGDPINTRAGHLAVLGLNISESTWLTSNNNLLTIINNIYILDIQNYSWVTTIPATTNQKVKNQLPNNKILQTEIGIGVGSAILVGILFFSGYWYYQRRRQDLNNNYFNYKGVFFAFILRF